MLSFLFAAFLALPGAAQAQRPGEIGFTIQDWGGINSYNDSARISDADAQDAENVLTDRGFLEPRNGIVLSTALPSGTITSLGHYGQSTSNRYLVIHSTINVWRWDFGTALTLISTVNATGTISMVPAFTNLYIADGLTGLVQITATSSSTVAAAPVCTYLEFGYERIWCANIPTESNSRVRVSSFGGAGYWTVPVDVATNGDAPNVFDFQKDDGETITCQKMTPWGMVEGKPHSLHIIKGLTNLSFRKEVISPTVGCADNRGMQMHEGILTWYADDGIYQWAGAGPPVLISRDVDVLIRGIQQGARNINAWAVDSQSDFEQGVVNFSGAGALTNTTITPGSIVPSSWSLINQPSVAFASAATNIQFDTATLSNGLVISSNPIRENWAGGTTAGSNGWVVQTGSFDIQVNDQVTDGKNYLRSTGNAGVTLQNVSQMAMTQSSGSWSWNYYFHNSLNNGQCGSTSGSSADCWEVRFLGDSGGKYYAVGMKDNGGLNTHIVDLRLWNGSAYTTFTSTTITIPPNTITTFEVVRSSAGNLFLYIGGVFASSSTQNTTVGDASLFKFAATGASNCSVFQFITNIYGYQYKRNAKLVSSNFNTGLSTPTWGAFSSTYSFSLQNVEYQTSFYTQSSTSPNNDLYSSLLASSDALRVTVAQQQYIRYEIDVVNFISTKTPSIFSVGLTAETTGYYLSYVKFIGATGRPLVWSQFAVADSGGGGAEPTYQIRAASYAFAATDAAPSWNTQLPNATIGISTGAYVQWRSLWPIDSGTQTASIARVAVNFTDGPIIPVASASFKQRYYFCAQFSSTTATNDACLVLQRNNKWVKLTGPKISSLDVFDSVLYGGSALNSKVWKIMVQDVYNDDGSAISSYWLSKDFMFAPNGRDWPVGGKVLNEVWLDTGFSTGTIMSISYAVDKSTSLRTGTLNLGAYGASINKKVPFNKTYGLGKYFRFKLSNSQNDHPYQINAYSIYGEPQMKTQD